MDKHILKNWLLEKRPGAYATIVETYKEEALKLKPALFINWLSIQLAIKEESISYTAINSAVKRLRLKQKNQKTVISKTAENDFNTEIPVKLGFK